MCSRNDKSKGSSGSKGGGMGAVMGHHWLREYNKAYGMLRKEAIMNGWRYEEFDDCWIKPGEEKMSWKFKDDYDLRRKARDLANESLC